MKLCTKCHRSKKHSAFAKNARAVDGLFVWCRRCTSLHGKKYRRDPKVRAQRAAAYKTWAKKNPERRRRWKRAWNKANPRKLRQYMLKHAYGITQAEYRELLQKQKGLCGICRTAKPGGRWKRFVVDHSHRTGKVRGLLCNTCNTAIGLLGDCASVLSRASRWVA